MLWVNIGLIVLIVTLVVGLLSLIRPGLWSIGRTIVPVGLQVAGVFIVTWLLVQQGQSASAALPPPPEQLNSAWTEVRGQFIASLELIAVAMLWGTGLGTMIAALVASRRSPALAAVATVASLVWIVPGFLVAILAQDAQSTIFEVTGTDVAGQYGQATLTQLIWCAVVLGIRPAAYTFRQGQVLIAEQALAQHVRTAFAKGLPWSQVMWRHIVRPAAAGLIETSVNSMRLVVGLLPLVEFFFAYPGLGRLLLLSLGVPSAADQAPEPKLAVAVACAVLLALIVVCAEVPLRAAARRLDPRLAEAY